jgi:hypothetical protein
MGRHKKSSAYEMELQVSYRVCAKVQTKGDIGEAERRDREDTERTV